MTQHWFTSGLSSSPGCITHSWRHLHPPHQHVIKFTDDATVVGHTGWRSWCWQSVASTTYSSTPAEPSVWSQRWCWCQHEHCNTTEVVWQARQKLFFLRSLWRRSYWWLHCRECSAVLHHSAVCRLFSGRQKSSAEGRGTTQEIISCPRPSLKNIVSSRQGEENHRRPLTPCTGA